MHTLVTLFFGLGRVAVVVDADELAIGAAEVETTADVVEVGRVTVCLWTRKDKAASLLWHSLQKYLTYNTIKTENTY